MQAENLHAIIPPVQEQLSEPFALKEYPRALADRVPLETVTPPMFGKESKIENN